MPNHLIIPNATWNQELVPYQTNALQAYKYNYYGKEVLVPVYLGPSKNSSLILDQVTNFSQPKYEIKIQMSRIIVGAVNHGYNNLQINAELEVAITSLRSNNTIINNLLTNSFGLSPVDDDGFSAIDNALVGLKNINQVLFF